MKLLKKAVAVLAITAMSLSMVACNSTNNKNNASTPNSTESPKSTDSASKDEHKDDVVVAKVNDISIYKSALDSQMSQIDYYMAMYYGEDFKKNAEAVKAYNTYLDQGVDSLVNSEIVVLKAKERKDIQVTDKDIDEKLASLKAQYDTEDAFNKAMEQAGVTMDSLKENIEKGLYLEKLVDLYKKDVEVTDTDINDYYNKNIAQYTTKAGANLSHILVKTEDEANEVLKKYNAGTSFEDLAKQYGTDGTKDKGGSLGYIPYDTTSYDKDFMEGAKKLGEGEVSKPVKTQFGWHLIKADGIKKEDVVQKLDEVKTSIQENLTETKAQDKIMQDLEGWKKDYKVETFKDTYELEVPAATTSPEASANASTDAASPAASASAAPSESAAASK